MDIDGLVLMHQVISSHSALQKHYPLPDPAKNFWAFTRQRMDLPVRLSLAMLNIARWYALRTSSSLTTSLMRFQRSAWSSHW